jgi:phosphatidylglycerol---prolipoprotein diacylglyceryl transferase
MYPLLFRSGSFAVNSYDFFLSIGFFIGTIILLREIRRDLENQVKLLDLTIWIIIISIVGARLFHVVVEAPKFYIEHPLNIVKIWNGGWVFYGGFLSAIVFGIFYLKKHKMNVLRCADIYSLPVAIGLMFGRLGCFMAGCCYGKICPTWFLFGNKFSIVNFVRPQAEPLDTSLYPTQMAEALVGIGIFFFLFFYRPKKRFHGELSAIFLIVYSIARFILEYFRADDIRGLWLGGTLSTSQILSIPLLVIGIILFFNGNKAKLFIE